MPTPRTYAKLLLLISIVVLGACGGGNKDNESTQPPKPASSNWDELKWDKDNWS